MQVVTPDELVPPCPVVRVAPTAEQGAAVRARGVDRLHHLDRQPQPRHFGALAVPLQPYSGHGRPLSCGTRRLCQVAPTVSWTSSRRVRFPSRESFSDRPGGRLVRLAVRRVMAARAGHRAPPIKSLCYAGLRERAEGSNELRDPLPSRLRWSLLPDVQRLHGDGSGAFRLVGGKMRGAVAPGAVQTPAPGRLRARLDRVTLWGGSGLRAGAAVDATTSANDASMSQRR